MVQRSLQRACLQLFGCGTYEGQPDVIGQVTNLTFIDHFSLESVVLMQCFGEEL